MLLLCTCETKVYYRTSSTAVLCTIFVLSRAGSARKVVLIWNVVPLPSFVFPPFPSDPPVPSTRQHLSYDDCLEVKKEYYQNCYVLDCVTQYSQSAAHLCEQFLQVKQIGFVTLGPLCCA